MPQDFNALATLQAFQGGRDMRNQRQAQEQAQHQAMASQGLSNTRNKIETALSSGDREGAQQLAQGSGDADVMAGFRSTIQQMDEQQRETGLRNIRATRATVRGVRAIPAEQRPQWVMNNAPTIEAMGLNPQEVAQMDMSDDNLAALEESLAAHDDELYRSLAQPRVLGENDTLVNGINNNQTIGEAGIEARGLEQYSNETARQGNAIDRERLAENRRQFDIGREDAANAAANPPPPDPSDIDGLRESAEDAIGSFRDIEEAYSRIRASAESPSASGDLALIFNFMKMLDPGSTVREGEFATAQNAAGVPDRVRAAWNNAQRGERMTPEQRQDFVSRADGLYGAQRRLAEDRLTQYREIADNRNLDQRFAIPRFTQFQDSQDAPAQPEQPTNDIGGRANRYLRD